MTLRKRDSPAFGTAAVLSGVGAVLLCWYAVTLAVFYMWNDLVPFVGMFQPLYLLPAYFALRRFSYKRVAKGVLGTTITVFVLNAVLVIVYVLIILSMPRVG